MSQAAHVDSLEALKHFKLALIKFSEAASVALGDAEADIQRVLTWLETEQDSYWHTQVRKRTEIVSRCKDAVRQKKLFKDFSGRTPSAIDEEKALYKAQRALEEEEQKLVATRKWAKRLAKEILVYKGDVQRFATNVQVDLPAATAKLENYLLALDAYVSLRPEAPGGADKGYAVDEAAGMGRASSGERKLPRDIFRSLRAKTAPADLRAAAAPGSVGPEPWKCLILGADQTDVISSLNLRRLPIAVEYNVIIAQEAALSEQIYLQRLAPSYGTDSGWYIGSADAPGSSNLRAVQMGALLAFRADFRDILGLPEGFLVVIEKGVITAILDAEDNLLWTAAPPK